MDIKKRGKQLTLDLTQNLKQTYKISQKQEKNPYNNYDTPVMDPRDIKLYISFEQIIKSIKSTTRFSQKVKKQLRKWLVAVFEKVTSDAFHKYNQDKLNYEQVKTYTSKNYIFNINKLLQTISFQNTPITHQILRFIDQQSKQIINQLILKYPQSQAKGSTKKLKKTINRPDNRQSDQFDLLLDPKVTGVQFKYKDNGNYSREIMQTLNYIMEISTKPLIEGSTQLQSNFQAFNMMVQNIFTLAGCPQYERQFFKQAEQYQKQNNILEEKLIIMAQQQQLFKQSEQYKRIDRKLLKMLEDIFNSQKKQYKDQIQLFKKLIQKQCYYDIKNKIPSNIKLFTKQEIQSQFFRVPDSSVLRVMTKWVQQLSDKITYSDQLIKKRVERFKNKKGQFIDLTYEQKQSLNEALNEQQNQLRKIIKNLKDKFLSMETKMLIDCPKSLYTNQVDGAIGIFSARTQACIGKYLFEYLNALIHSLMYVPIRAKQLYKLKQNNKNKVDQKYYNQLRSLNLITFKVGDLLRSRCKSSQKHIIQIFSFLSKINEVCPKLIKMVRVKDRLQGKDNDLLINLFFMNKIQCQIQLSVSTKINQKQQKYNKFNHFIYQLKRAEFGAISQCACILAQYDPVIKNFCQRQQLAPKIQLYETRQDLDKIHQQIRNKNMKQQISRLPFFCCLCRKFDINKNYDFYQNKFAYQDMIQCNGCYQNHLKLSKNKQTLFSQILRRKYMPQQIQTIKKHFSILNTQSIKDGQQLKGIIQKGLIVSKHTLLPMPQYFQIIDLQQKLYFICGQVNDSNTKGKTRLIVDYNEGLYKKMSSQILIKIIDEKLLHYDQQKKQLIHVCDCCQENKIKLGSTFNAKFDLTKQRNQKNCRNTYLGLKQTFNISNRNVTTQLKKCVNKQMKSVKRFNAQNNTIDDMSFTKYLTKLQEINMSSNKIYKIQGIQETKTLKKILLNDNQITKIQCLTKLSSLTALYLNKNKIKVIENLQSLSSLKTLCLDYNQIQQINGLSNLTSLRTLSLSRNSITEIRGLSSLTSLTTLSLDYNQITQIKNLQKLTSLTILFLSYNKIIQIKNLEDLIELTDLNLHKNKIKQIKNLQKLQKLTTLSLDSNQITQIKNLQKLQSLKNLYLYQNKITQIKNLQKLVNLKSLLLDKNQITQIKNLQNLKYLVDLSLSRNLIGEIKNLQNNKSLKVLSLSGNRIEEYNNMSIQQKQAFVQLKNRIQTLII